MRLGSTSIDHPASEYLCWAVGYVCYSPACFGAIVETYGLDEPTLRDLYHNQLLTQAEIAKRVGGRQGQISKLLRRWEIPRLSKADRLRLPPLSSEQIGVLLGSLLGDGSMSATGSTTARLYEGHSPKQNGYTQWKAQVLEPYTAHIFEADGLSFYTHGCRELRPYYDLFYGTGKRVFPSNLHMLITPRALAVWYMDDGSICNRFHPRISFGLCALSLRRAIRALRCLGLDPKAHPERGDNWSIMFPGQNELFYEMVGTHIPECMAHKLPDLTQRVKVVENRNAAKLTSERAADLYRGNLPVVEIAKLYEVGTSTVRRRLREAGIRPGKKKPRGLLSLEAVTARLGAYDPKEWTSLSDDDQARWVDEIGALLRHCPFPAKPPRSPQAAREDFDKLVALQPCLEDGTIVPRTWRGTTLCAEFFPNRYKASWRGGMTAFEAWHMEPKRRNAIRVQLRSGDPVVPHRVLRAVTMQCRTPTVFKPVIAKFMYQTFCPPGGTVWDPCAGYGGRLLGALAAGVKYVGTDVEPETVQGNLRLAGCLGMDATVVQSPAEEFDPGPVDLVFTSPPYFDVEQYSLSSSQSYKRYADFDAWLEGFLRPVIRTSARVLSSGRVLAFNVADIKLRKKVLPLVESTKSIAGEEGFIYDTTIWMPISNLNRKGRAAEPVLVFRRG